MPQKLPRAYRKWIGQAAQVDPRLVLALRNIKEGKFVYGRDTGQAGVLESLCQEHALPLTWGNPAISIPIPCEVVHAGAGPSCLRHALLRFLRSWQSSFIMYFPIQILLKTRHLSIRNLFKAFTDAFQSSAFLGAFISLFYYSVCFTRSSLGPILIRYNILTPQLLDGGTCVGAGCLTCGWSVLIENPRRRAELALFVAPRAAAIFLPRKYDRGEVCSLSVLYT